MPTTTEKFPHANAQILVAAGTDLGHGRNNNEDDFLAASMEATQVKPLDLMKAPRMVECGPRGVLVALSDGMGGAAAGEVASQMTLEVTSTALAGQVAEGLPRGNVRRARALGKAVALAHEALIAEAEARPETTGMGATLTAIWLVDGRLYLAQIGDSRLYRLRDGYLEQLSVDQSPVGRLVETGEITENEARKHPQKNLIDQAVGTSQGTLRPDLDWFELRPGDLLLLTSDGLSDALSREELRRQLVSPTPSGMSALDGLQRKVRELIRAALETDMGDNITAMLVRVARMAPPGGTYASGERTSSQW